MQVLISKNYLYNGWGKGSPLLSTAPLSWSSFIINHALVEPGTMNNGLSSHNDVDILYLPRKTVGR